MGHHLRAWHHQNPGLFAMTSNSKKSFFAQAAVLPPLRLCGVFELPQLSLREGFG
jgi:hypothetical protein